jgi:hypothetical protein
MPPGPKQSFHIRAEFHAPLDFVFRWCTDYRADDARREKEQYLRRIVSRTRRRVIYEDLSDHEGGGWSWTRHDVTLRPPDRWTSVSVGSHRTLTLDYRLTRLGPERTRLDLRWSRRSTGLGEARVAPASYQQGSAQNWKNFGAALEKDYRASRRARRR